MRIWCDPTKFEQYALNPADVVAAIHEQNDQTKGGQTGAYPLVAGQEINLTVNASSRLERVEQFENIILRTKADGSMLRLRDVARIELNGETFNVIVRDNGDPSVAMLFMLAPGANALETGNAIKKQMKAYSSFFPPGMDYVYTYDTIPFVEISIQAVFKTLGEAIVLVFLVMYLFLQKFRATFIPTIAIPVVMIGTFGVLAAAGYSINTLTMFGMVLAIGLLVDDAIVVVENVERLMREENLPPVAAARKSMTQISGALVGVATVIAAVFVPMAFMPGSVGILYRQFSITIVTTMAISALVALILSPALCATLLKAEHSEKQNFFGCFNRWFERVSNHCRQQVARVLHRPRFVFIAFGCALLLAGWLFFRLPTSFVPNEDQGAFYAIAQLPSGATMERTDAVLAEIRDYLLTEEKLSVRNVQTMAGYSFIGSGQNVGQAFISLRHWDAWPLCMKAGLSRFLCFW
jgi:multidrug efflux pump